MNRKRICSVLMAGVMTLGIVLSSGVSAEAAPEDWFRFDVEADGKQQPTIQIIGAPLWGISYGYTLHSDYKYVLQLPYDESSYGYFDDGANDGYSYYGTLYYGDGTWEADINLEYPFSKEGIESKLPDGDAIAANLKLTITACEPNSEQAMEECYANGIMMVYDKDNHLVDTFPLASVGAGQTAPAEQASAPAAGENAPAANAAEPQSNPAPVVNPTESQSNPAPAASVNPAGGDSVTEVAKEIIKGRWGVGRERRAKLEAAGYDYKEVQKKVYELMK